MIALHLFEASACTHAVKLSSKKRFYGVKGIIMLCHGGPKNVWGRLKTYKQIKTA